MKDVFIIWHCMQGGNAPQRGAPPIAVQYTRSMFRITVRKRARHLCTYFLFKCFLFDDTRQIHL